MIKKNKGFTLIELLAVIVILAIIALIAVPIVLNLTERARKSSFARSAEGVLKSAKLSYSSKMLNSFDIEDTAYYCSNGECLSDTVDSNGNKLSLDISGSTGEGDVYVYKDGTVAFSLTNGHYCAVKYAETSKIEVIDGTCAENNIDVSTDTTAPIIKSVNNSVTTSTIKVIVAAEDKQSKIKLYNYKLMLGENVIVDYADDATLSDPQNAEIYGSSIYTFKGLQPGQEYIVKVKAYNKIPTSPSFIPEGEEGTNVSEEKTVTISTGTLDRPIVTIVPDDIEKKATYTQAKVIRIDYNNDASVSGSYVVNRLDETEVLSGTNTEFLVTENNVDIIATVVDSNNNRLSQTVRITTIDTSYPTISFTTENTSSSIKVKAVGSDNDSDIYGYLFSKDGGTTWESKNGVNQVQLKGTDNDEYEFKNLTTDTYYIMVKAINNAYHNTEVSDNESIRNAKDASLGTRDSINLEVVLTPCPTPHVSVDPEGDVWASSKTVTIDNENIPNGCVAQYYYSNDPSYVPTDDEYIDGTGDTFTQDGYFINRITDGTNNKTSHVTQIQKIDSTSPTIVKGTVTIEGNNVEIETTMSDEVGGSGLVTPTCVYGLTTDYGSNCSSKTAEKSVLSDDLDYLETYHYKICAVDLAGNADNCITDSVTTGLPTASNIYYSHETYTNGQEITIQKALENLYEQLN